MNPVIMTSWAGRVHVHLVRSMSFFSPYNIAQCLCSASPTLIHHPSRHASLRLFISSAHASHTIMSDSTQPTAASSKWLQEQLQTLMNSPYIHFNQPKIGGLRMGHGPIDLFSTRFSNLFAKDATGVVAGKEVDRDGLKEALLALQKKWNNDTAKFAPATGLQAGQVGTRAEWTPSNADQPLDVTATATVQQEGGGNRIASLTLDGDQSLFTK